MAPQKDIEVEQQNNRLKVSRVHEVLNNKSKNWLNFNQFLGIQQMEVWNTMTSKEKKVWLLLMLFSFY